MITTVTLNASIDKRYVVEHLAPGQVHRVQEVRNTAGGKGLNVARTAALLGEQVTAAGIIGGAQGEYFLTLCSNPPENLHFSFLKCAAETRSCINIYETQAGRHSELLEPGQAIEPQVAAAFENRFAQLVLLSDVITLSGSLPPGLPASYYQLLINRAAQAGIPVLLDTSGELLRLGIKAQPTFVKPNLEELGQLMGKPISSKEGLLDAIGQLQKETAQTVLVSLGAQGAVMAGGDYMLYGCPPKIEPVNTVGCGDSMLGALAVGLCRKLPPQEMLRLALAVSAANALSETTGHFYKEHMDAILPQVKVRLL